MSISTKTVRLPVKLVDGHWELLYGGKVRVRDGAVGDLHLSKSSFDDAEFLGAITARRCVPVLPAGTVLHVALSVKPGLSATLKGCLIVGDSTTHERTELLGSDTRFVPVSLCGPTIAQQQKGQSEGGLRLWLEGMEPRSIESGIVKLPEASQLAPVESLNQAFTRLSEIFEPWRKAHTGSIYERVFYQETDDRWYPLKCFRESALAAAERGLIKRLWERVAAELGLQMFKKGGV